MNYLDRKLRMDYLLSTIEKGNCISVKQMAVKFSCSERTVKRMISELRDLGHEVKYSATHQKFVLA